jgi:hypothetical protein
MAASTTTDTSRGSGAPDAKKANRGSPFFLNPPVRGKLRILAVVGADGFEPPTYAL